MEITLGSVAQRPVHTLFVEPQLTIVILNFTNKIMLKQGLEI